MSNNIYAKLPLVSDSTIGYLSSFMFAGMMFGAVGWGSCKSPVHCKLCGSYMTFFLTGSDLLGRSTAFNLTLFFTAIFGLVASLAPTFPLLCTALFFLGTSVGVRLPSLRHRNASLTSDHLGLNANRWDASSRTHAEREAIYGDSFVCFLLLWIRLVCSGGHLCYPRTFVPWRHTVRR